MDAFLQRYAVLRSQGIFQNCILVMPLIQLLPHSSPRYLTEPSIPTTLCDIAYFFIILVAFYIILVATILSLHIILVVSHSYLLFVILILKVTVSQG